MLTIHNFTFRYSKESDFLWKPLNLSLDQGQIVLLKGKNGSGKTTLLHCLCGIIPQVISGDSQGHVLYNNQKLASIPLKSIAPEINLLFQESEKQIFMPTVEEEIAFGAENICIEKDEIASRVNLLLKKFNIKHLRYEKTANLSFGQKKLVVLTSILAMSPQVLLIDEFCAGMEGIIIKIFIDYIQELRAHGHLIVIAEHETVFDKISDMTICLEGKQNNF